MKETNKNQWVKWYNKNFHVDFSGQLKVLIALIIVILPFSAIICYSSYEWVLQLRPLFDQMIAGPRKPAEAFQILANLLLQRLILSTILMLFLLIVVGTYVTHRLTGPIWKLHRDIENFLKGEKIEMIQFRKHDAFRYLPPLINKLLEGYRGPRGDPPKMPAASE